MITPSLADFKKLNRKGNLIAISRILPADMETPVSSFLKLAQHEPYSFLLESAEQEEKIGRYSIIGLNPEAILSAQRNKIFLTRRGKTNQVVTRETIVGIIEKMMKTYTLANPEALPGFCGGFVGFLSYEQVEHFESVKLGSKKGVEAPQSVFFLCQEFVVFDHFRKTIALVSIVDAKNKKQAAVNYRSALKRLQTLSSKLNRPLKISSEKKSRSSVFSIQSNTTPAEFKKKVQRVKEYIRAGDCIQVVLSQRFSLPKLKNDFQIYRALRSINPSPYMFYFRCKDFKLIGSSPELLVRNHGRDAEVRPIAGTRPRGITPPQDLVFEENLKKSVKEMAEHLMLVDLGRNDLGRVCEFNSIQVKNFAHVDRYSHVMHLVSDVVGRLKPNKNCFDLLKATFPAGTVTGAPKVRAMQIIDELESESRGPYAGCLGYFGFNRDMEMCITIRTLVVNSKGIYLQAGAGIVKDSIPEKEYQETINKAKALMKAVEKARNL